MLGSIADIDNDNLTYSVIQEPSNGSFSLNDNKVAYTPNANFNGNDSFTFKSNDGSVDSNISTVTIVVNSINDAPTTKDISKEVDEDNELEILLDANDIDNDKLYYKYNKLPRLN